MQKQPRGCKEFKVMSEEMNDKSGMYNSGSGRDGYKSRDVENNRSGRTGRPRINSAGRVWSDRTPSRGSYGAGRRQRTDGSEGQRGYRPSGDDASRSRYGAPHAGGYRSNASYNNNGGGAFRPSFTRADDMPTGGDWGGRPNGGASARVFRPVVPVAVSVMVATVLLVRDAQAVLATMIRTPSTAIRNGWNTRRRISTRMLPSV